MKLSAQTKSPPRYEVGIFVMEIFQIYHLKSAFQHIIYKNIFTILIIKETLSVDYKYFCGTIIVEDSDKISYRGVEAIDCVGMQPIVELVFGLCGNLKPNRFFRTERKRFIRALHLQGFLYLQKERFHMNLLQQSAKSWKELIDYYYLFTYGYKKQLHQIKLTFSPEDYRHLAGFQYMKDISLPNYSSAKVVDKILDGKISFEIIQKAVQYNKNIEPRLKALVHLKESLDSEFNLYSYMPQMYPFSTGIKADYLISSHLNIDNFIFIIKSNFQGELKCDFLCCSIFERGDRNYEINQRSKVLMKKERIHIPSNTTDILLDRLTIQSEEK